MNTGTPAAYFNGNHLVLGGSYTSSIIYDKYLAAINDELKDDNYISITAGKSDQNDQVNVIVTNNSMNTIINAQLVGVVYSDLGISEHRFIVRDMTSSKVSLAAGETKFNVISLEVPGPVVVFLKDSSGEILQSVLVT